MTGPFIAARALVAALWIAAALAKLGSENARLRRRRWVILDLLCAALVLFPAWWSILPSLGVPITGIGLGWLRPKQSCGCFGGATSRSREPFIKLYYVIASAGLLVDFVIGGPGAVALICAATAVIATAATEPDLLLLHWNGGTPQQSRHRLAQSSILASWRDSLISEEIVDTSRTRWATEYWLAAWQVDHAVMLRFVVTRWRVRLRGVEAIAA